MKTTREKMKELKKRCRKIFTVVDKGGNFLDGSMCFASLWDWIEIYFEPKGEK